MKSENCSPPDLHSVLIMSAWYYTQIVIESASLTASIRATVLDNIEIRTTQLMSTSCSVVRECTAYWSTKEYSPDRQIESLISVQRTGGNLTPGRNSDRCYRTRSEP